MPAVLLLLHCCPASHCFLYVQIDGLYQQLCASQQAPQQVLQPGHNRKAELTALLTRCGAWYQDVFFFDVSDEEYQIVAQQVRGDKKASHYCHCSLQPSAGSVRSASGAVSVVALHDAHLGRVVPVSDVCLQHTLVQHTVTLQVSEANQQRKRQREDIDRSALALGLRAQPLVCDVALMQQQQQRAADPRLNRRGSPAAVGEAARAQEQKPSAGADGVVRLPLPQFARDKDWLGQEVHGSLQQHMHEVATAAARDRVLSQRQQLIQQARQGGQPQALPTPPQQQAQQQQQAEEGEVAEVEVPLSEAALDLERADAQWEVVCFMSKPGTTQPGG